MEVSGLGVFRSIRLHLFTFAFFILGVFMKCVLGEGWAKAQNLGIRSVNLSEFGILIKRIIRPVFDNFGNRIRIGFMSDLVHEQAYKRPSSGKD